MRVVVLIGAFVLALSACGPRAISPELDTPSHHTANGMKLLKAEKIEPAMREFNRARELDPAYSRAWIGLGLVHSMNGAFGEGLKAMRRADALATAKRDKTAVQVGFMRVFTIGGEKIGPGWLEQVENRFRNAVSHDPDNPEPYFFMALAYKKGRVFDKAASLFSRVIEMKKEYAEEARKEHASLIQSK